MRCSVRRCSVLRTTDRTGAPLLLSEVVATAGLLLIIVALARTGRTQHASWAVGAWIGAAYWFTASTSFANPAVTIGRTLTDTYAGIAPGSAPAFIAAQIAGGALGTVLAVALYPASGDRDRRRPRPSSPDDGKESLCQASPKCCSSAPTTRDGRRWPLPCSTTRPPDGSRSRSAGSQPATELNPAVVQAMAEIGLDITREFPKRLTTDQVQAADVVITMGCGDACPVYPGKRYLDWDLPDPAGLDLPAIRPIRDEIRRRVAALITELS